METFPSTIPDLLARRASRPGPWLLFEGDTWSLADVLDEVDRRATGMADRGVVHGDRVAFVGSNRPETLFTWFAANQLGAIAVPMNPAYKPAEAAGVLALTRPRLVVGEGDGAVPDADLAKAGRGAPRADVQPDDVAVLLATSGSTGAPKAVMQTHRAYTLTAEAFPWWVGLDATDRLLVALPMFHINAQVYSTMGALGAGASLAILPRFSASRFWQECKRLGATEFNGVGALVNILLRTPPSDADRDHTIRACYTALALPEEQHRGFEERFGLRMTVGYGLSETPFGTVWPKDEAPRYGTMGRLRQHPRLGAINRGRVVKDDGTEAGDDEPGELLLDNPAVMRGYFEDPDQTARALDGGWLHTGDVVKRAADGTFTFVARKKDVIRRRGENVAAGEIESVIAQHPAVREVAVVGVPSELGEEEIVAYVAPREIDVDALRAFVAERLADFKVPSVFHLRDALPRTATERIAKHLLR